MSGVHLYIGKPRRGGTTVACLVYLPVCALKDGVVHAVDGGVASDWVFKRSRRKTWDTACGTRAYPMLPTAASGPEEHMMPFPPRVSTLPPGWSRCRDCHEATGRKRPEFDFIEKEDA